MLGSSCSCSGVAVLMFTTPTRLLEAVGFGAAAPAEAGTSEAEVASSETLASVATTLPSFDPVADRDADRTVNALLMSALLSWGEEM
jgi:hypothetical protein